MRLLPLLFGLSSLLLALPAAADVRVEDPSRYHEAGLQYMKEEKWNLAVTQLEKSIAAKRNDWRVWVDLGDALCIDPRGVRYGSKDRNERAAAAYREAAELNPGSARAWNNLGWLRAKSATALDEGLVAALRAVEIDESKSGYLDTLAEVHFARGEIALAVATIEKALKITPGDEYLQRQLARFEALDRADPDGAPKPRPPTPKKLPKKIRSK